MKFYNITNNYNCICESCLEDIRDGEMYEPAHFYIINYGDCEDCGLKIRPFKNQYYPQNELIAIISNTCIFN